jgi:hypothetical protein
MGALISAGVFGLVPHPAACLEPYRRDGHGSSLCSEEDHPPLRGVQDAAPQEQIEQIGQPRHKLDSAEMGGGVQ